MLPTYQGVIELLRHYNVLGAWRDEDICYQLDRSIADNCLAFELDENNRLKSICLGYWHGKCSVHVVAIAGPKGSLKNFINHLKKNFPHIARITGHRKGELKEFKLK